MLCHVLLFCVTLLSASAATAEEVPTCAGIVPMKERPDRVSITDFGGVGDGKTVNTDAFREAIYRIQRLRRRGGTLLYIPSGIYLTASFNLTSHMTLYLADGAVIKAIQGSAIHCIARSSIAHCVVTKLQTGNICSIQRFTLAPNKELYRVRRDDPYLIQLEGSTIIQKLECSDFGFVRQPFHLKDIEDIAFNGSKYLIDVVGRVINMSEYKPTKNGSHYLDFHLINERGRSIKVTLWGLLGKELIDRCANPAALNVIVLPAMNITEYRGGIKLCSTSGTMIYDSHDIPEIAALRQLMCNGELPPPENNGTLLQILKLGREQRSLNRMHSITLNCSVNIMGIHPQSTWTYNSCGESGCKKGLKPVEDKLWCESCVKICDFPILRYRLRLEVSDDTTTLVVTLFDDVAEALLKKTAADLIAQMENHGSADEFPKEVLQLVGTSHVFELKSHTYYNHGQYESFTVTRVLTPLKPENVVINNNTVLPNENSRDGVVVENVAQSEIHNMDGSVIDVVGINNAELINLESVKESKEIISDAEKEDSCDVPTPAKQSEKRKFVAAFDED